MQGFKLLLQKLSPEQANTLLVLKLVQTRCSSGPSFSTLSHVLSSKSKDPEHVLRMDINLLVSKLVLAWFSQFCLEQGGDPLGHPPRHLRLSAARAGTRDIDGQREVGDLHKKIFTGTKYQILDVK